jgi:hypothetical protein
MLMVKSIPLKKEEGIRKRLIYVDTEPQLKTENLFIVGVLNRNANG